MTRHLVRHWTIFALTFAWLLAPFTGPVEAQNQPRPLTPIGPPQASQFSRPPMAARAPFAPQGPQVEEYIDRVLVAWQDRSSKIQCYRSTFERWEYDTVFGPKDTFKTYSTGVVQYAAPDKGMFRVDTTSKFTPPAQPGGKPTYAEQDESSRQHWICDGTAVIEMNYSQKKMIRRQLPPHMQGKAIAEGPLPFLFGAKADTVKQRYWVRLATPKDVSDECHLELWPKTQEDASNFKFVVVVLDQQQFLPSRLVVYDVNFRPGMNESRTSFQFKNREVNAKDLLSKLNIFHREFFEPALPSGWQKIEDKFVQPPAAEQRAEAPNIGPLPFGAPRQANGPPPGTNRR